MIRFSIKTEYIELYKLLKSLSLCSSGGEAKYFISEGLVKYNGKVETRKRLKLKPGDIVEFEENKIILE